MKYLKEFENHAQYEAFTATTDFIKPNVSHCIREAEVHYSPWVETRVVAKYNVTNTSSPTSIGYGQYISGFSEIEIDGVVQPSVVSAYTFDTVGEHTIKYTLTDPTSIGYQAFRSCSGLTSVTIPDSVTSIGSNAFNYCSGLTSVTIPDGVTSIGSNAFGNCPSLSSITVNSNNTTYDSRGNCNAIIKTSTNELVVGCKNTVIPNTVTSIGEYAFNGCSGLISVTIPDTVTSIGDYAFRFCTGLTSITIPNSVTSIGWYAFADCSSLTSITIDAETPPTLGSSAFDGTNNCPIYVPSCESAYSYKNNWNAYANRISVVGSDCGNMIIYESSSKLTETTSNNNAGLHTYAFSGTSGQLTITSHTFSNGTGTIYFDDNVTSIGQYAFNGCSGLTSIKIHDGVTSIGSYAFRSCSSLISITIGSGVTSIGVQAFQNCSGLTSIRSNATTAPAIQSGTFRNVKTNGTLYVPSGSSGYDVWMRTSNYYLGLYNWTKVEQ